MLKKLALLGMVLSLAACATSGETFSQSQKNAAPLSADQARLYMYRESSMMGSAIQPSILLDGVKVRDSVPGSFTVRDIQPGAHKLSNETETEKSHDFTAVAQQEIFVREAPGMGWVVGRIHFEPVDVATGLSEISDLHVQTLGAKSKE